MYEKCKFVLKKITMEFLWAKKHIQLYLARLDTSPRSLCIVTLVLQGKQVNIYGLWLYPDLV